MATEAVPEEKTPVEPRERQNGHVEAPERKRVNGWRAAAARSTQAIRGLLPFALEADTKAPDEAMCRDRRYRRLLGLADVVAAGLALAICIPLLGEDRLAPAALLGLPLVVLMGKLMGLYDRDELLVKKTTLDEAPALFQLSTLCALVLWLGHGFLVAGALGRNQVLGFWLVLFVLLLACRWGARATARYVAPTERILLLGAPAACETALRKIQSADGVDATVVAQFDFGETRDAQDAEALLEFVAADREVHRVVLAPPGGDQNEVLDLVRAAKALGLKVSVLPRMLEVVGSSVEFEDLDGLNVLGVRRFGLTRSSRLVKRSMDLALSMVVLAVLAPLMAVIAVAIKLDSPGPVLFRQRRIGRDGAPFQMLKFRTMVDGAEGLKAELAGLNEADGLFKIADDPRCTRVGHLLRRMSLDELPQLINVLRGEMSLVGPRPLVSEDDERVEGWYRRRLHLTPGMTGRWQVLGSARLPLDEMVKLDYLYFANWSLWGDVKIILRTLPFVLRRRGL